jgi:flagellar basal-body rod protein FlgG
MKMHNLAMEGSVRDINNQFTTGYKSEMHSFHDTLRGLEHEKHKNLGQGVPKKTNRELDFAIEGNGFFEIQMPDGTSAYTRDGAFKLNAQGEIVSSQGFTVVNKSTGELKAERGEDNVFNFQFGIGSSRIVLPPGEPVRVLDDGTVLIDETEEKLGKFNLVNFQNPDGLIDIGNGLYMASEDVGQISSINTGGMISESKIKQGYLESSNSDIVKSMSNMVQLNSAVKADMKILKLLDQMQENLTSTITRNI